MTRTGGPVPMQIITCTPGKGGNHLLMSATDVPQGGSVPVVARGRAREQR